MTTKRAKGLDETEEEDRLSDLPDAILTHILSLIPTILAVRMSLLSKRWRHIWSTIPALDFSDSREMCYFRRPRVENNNERKKFFKFMDECLTARTRLSSSDTTVARFRLAMNFYGAAQKVDRWLRFPAKRGGGVKELDLSIVAQRHVHYRLPDDLLGSRAVTVLKLEGMELNTDVTITLPCLKEAYLRDIQMEDQVLTSLLSGCASLETLHVKHCSGLLFPKFVTPCLRALVFRNTGSFRSRQTLGVAVEAENLESFEYEGEYSSGECLLFLKSCPKMRALSLTRAHLFEKWLQYQIPQLSQLESLSLSTCFGLEQIIIWNKNLKTLLLRRGSSRLESRTVTATILAPDLVSFSYIGYSAMKLSLYATNLLESSIKIFRHSDQKAYDSEWYTDLINFLAQFNCCKSVRILCESEKALIIPNELREIHRSPLPDLKHLMVKTFQPLFRKAMFRKSLHWVSPLAKQH